jgi:hypothetical protein
MGVNSTRQFPKGDLWGSLDKALVRSACFGPLPSSGFFLPPSQMRKYYQCGGQRLAYVIYLVSLSFVTGGTL